MLIIIPVTLALQLKRAAALNGVFSPRLLATGGARANYPYRLVW